MTGNLLVNTRTKYTRWTIYLSSIANTPKFLTFSDVRKFGTTEYYPNLDSAPFWKKLGMDGLSITDISNEHFILQKAKRSRKSIKNFLLDQSVIAGVGNIYALESLWQAKLHPEKATLDCIDRLPFLCTILTNIFSDAISKGGSSISDFLGGEYQKFHKVYGREGKPCFRCGTNIERMFQAGRSTFYCPTCQIL